MRGKNEYKCVNCGEGCSALYKTYGPSVLKLTKCTKCKGVVDKYIEYDTVIVMIDLILVSKEAQRHIIYNTEFKSYWKLFLILIILETYGLWQSDSLFNIAINSMCGIKSNDTNSTHLVLPMDIQVPEWWKSHCWGWAPEHRGDNSDLFLWEKDFYVQFLSTFAGIVAFIGTMHSSMMILKSSSSKKVPIRRALKAFPLAHAGVLLTLAVPVWGSARAETDAVHYSLIFAYSFVMFLSVFTVLYECPGWVTMPVLVASNGAKYLTTFLATPRLRAWVN